MSRRTVKQLVTFAVIGGLNTLLDVGLYSLLVTIGLQFFIANLVSTSAGMALSFSLNRRITFKSSGNRSRQIFLFLIVTITGLWLLQPLVISIINASTQLAGAAGILLPKLIATIVSLVWNFVLYRTIVFRDSSSNGIDAVQ